VRGVFKQTFFLEGVFMNGKQEWLCQTLEETTDRQENLRWSYRVWDFKDWRTWLACCYALEYYVKNNREVLARMLRCLCDTEGDGSQNICISVCEAYCDKPYDNEIFILEVVRAAPEMLKRSAIFFGEEMFQGLLNHCVYDIPRKYYLSALSSLETIEEKQVIIDFLVYLTEEYPTDGSDNEKYHKLLAESLQVTGLKGGNSLYFNDY
jgi:hypothetical protein